MNVWNDNREGADVEKCRIIEELRSLDCEAASLIYQSRLMAAMYGRINRLIETLYKKEIGDDSVTVNSDDKDNAFNNAMSAHQKQAMSKEDIQRVFAVWGFDVSPECSIVPLENHILAS
jgi:hypothetical protein